MIYVTHLQHVDIGTFQYGFLPQTFNRILLFRGMYKNIIRGCKCANDLCCSLAAAKVNQSMNPRSHLLHHVLFTPEIVTNIRHIKNNETGASKKIPCGFIISYGLSFMSSASGSEKV